MDSEIGQILIYIYQGETDRLNQTEWVEIAEKKLEDAGWFGEKTNPRKGG